MPSWKRTSTSPLNGRQTYAMGLPVQIVTSAGRIDREHEDQFHLAAGGQCVAGNPGESASSQPTRQIPNEQLVKARVVWSTAPAPTVPVLAVTRIGGQSFVYVAAQDDKGTVAKQRAVTLGDTIGNDYAVDAGLKPGEKVIVSSIQFLIDGAPVKPTQLSRLAEYRSNTHVAHSRGRKKKCRFG